MRHVLKTWPCHFEKSWQGLKPFELRADDRLPRFQPGDTVVLAEHDPETGCELPRHIVARIGTVIRDRPQSGLRPGFAVLGILEAVYRDVPWSEEAPYSGRADQSRPDPARAGPAAEFPYHAELYWSLVENLHRLAEAVRDRVHAGSLGPPGDALDAAIADADSLITQALQTPAERLRSLREELALTGTEADRG